MRKAAVVIGVDRTGELAPLKAAASGAAAMSKWLKREGFEVACLTDANKPVTSGAVTDAIERFVTMPASYHLLVLYFSGHGYRHADSDFWLLSGAPQRTSEAINLRGASDLAQCCGIPNVVIVSDACRSIPLTRTGLSVRGVDGFPVFTVQRTTSKVDSFKATSDARPAYEGLVDGAPQSLLTAALLSAYRTPDDAMVRDVTVDGETLQVVPNRRLEEYLQRKVDALLAGIDRRLRQDLVIEVPSSDETFIGRVARRPARRRPVDARAMQPSPAADAPEGAADHPRDDARVAAAAVCSTLRQRALVPGRRPALFDDQGASVEARLVQRMPDAEHTAFDTGTGFVVRGAVVLRAAVRAAAPGAVACAANVFASGDGMGMAAILRIEGPDGAGPLPAGWSGSICLRLADGRSSLLAVLAGYISHVTVTAEGVASVSYVPSSNGRRWPDYAVRRDELDRLRAMAGLATEYDVFQMSSARDAQDLAERIRQGTSLDPALALYAAQAYARSGRDAQVVEVLEHLRADLGADLFDVRLLASRCLAGAPTPVWPVAPACPMLTRNWSLLRARGVTLPEPLRLAGAHLCDALWTTFDAQAGDALMAWTTEGDDR